MVSLSKTLVLLPVLLLCTVVSAQRHLRSAVPLNDINIEVKAEDNSRHGHAGGEEAERLKRQAERLDDINIKVDAVDNSHHGAGGHTSGEEAKRLKRNVGPLNAINIGVNATDNSKHGGGRKGGHPIPRGPGPVKPSKPAEVSGSEEEPAGSSETEGPAGDDGAGHDGACKGNNNNNNNNNNNGNSNNNNNNNNNNCNGNNNNNNNNNNNRLKRQASTRLEDINVKVDAVDNSRHGAGAGGPDGQEEAEGEDAGRLAQHG